MKIEIPIFHCFNNKYVIPAAVAFYSLLENSNPNYNYKLIVAHSDITVENQLKETIKEFKNSSLRFIKIDAFAIEWDNLSSKCHYSKEMFLKLNISSILKEYNKVIVSDVDVLYKNDISKDYIEFMKDEENYLAGVFDLQKMSSFKKIYEKEFTQDEINKLLIGAGYFFMNLKKIREDNLEKKFFLELKNNINRIKQPEQDILNLVCYPKIKKIPLRNMVCSYIYDLYDKNNLKDEKNWTKEELKNAIENPIQLHFAGSEKPWTKFDVTKSEDWFYYLAKTVYLKEFLMKLEYMVHPNYEGKVKKILKIFIPIGFRRKLILTLEKWKKKNN